MTGQTSRCSCNCNNQVESYEEIVMPDGKQMLNDLEFENMINKMNDRQLLEFTARQVYDVCIVASSNEGRITKLENRDKKFVGAVSGISGFIGTCLGAAVLFLINHFSRN